MGRRLDSIVRHWPVLLALGCRPAAPPAEDQPLLTPIASVSQTGVIGNRDPHAAIAPDGRWVAYSVQNELTVMPAAGGIRRVLPTATPIIRHLLWLPNGTAVITAEADTLTRWWSNPVGTGSRGPLWPTGTTWSATDSSGTRRTTQPSRIGWLAFAPTGTEAVGLVPADSITLIWTIPIGAGSPTVRRVSGAASFPAWSAKGELACLVVRDRTPRLSVPCGAATGPARPAYGPIAFDRAGDVLYFASPDDRGVLALWKSDRRSGSESRLTHFFRDSYAPSVASDGRILFKEQIYRTAVVVVDTPGGRPRQIMGPQAETPSWDPTGKWLGVTYGTWRRYVDDYQYPDIAQDAGIVAADSGELKTKPDRIVDDSPSEDQGIGWSPNNRWIAYHSHKDSSDDIWLRPADLSRPGIRITHLGRGAESGWPRWSPDGRWIVFGANGRGPRERWVIYRIPANQETGETKPEEEVAIDARFGAVAAEWLSATSIVIDGFTPPDEHVLAVIDIKGGKPRLLHPYRNRQYYPGLGASPDGRWVFFAAPAPDGFMQIFRIAAAGGPAEQITHDPFDKTQPASSVTGRLAYAVWEYRMQFWTLTLR